MERYKEISLAELFELILKDDYNEIYFQERNNRDLKNAAGFDWKFKEFKAFKWFKREVID